MIEYPNNLNLSSDYKILKIYTLLTLGAMIFQQNDLQLCEQSIMNAKCI